MAVITDSLGDAKCAKISFSEGNIPSLDIGAANQYEEGPRRRAQSLTPRSKIHFGSFFRSRDITPAEFELENIWKKTFAVIRSHSDPLSSSQSLKASPRILNKMALTLKSHEGESDEEIIARILKDAIAIGANHIDEVVSTVIGDQVGAWELEHGHGCVKQPGKVHKELKKKISHILFDRSTLFFPFVQRVESFFNMTGSTHLEKIYHCRNLHEFVTAINKLYKRDPAKYQQVLRLLNDNEGEAQKILDKLKWWEKQEKKLPECITKIICSACISKPVRSPLLRWKPKNPYYPLEIRWTEAYERFFTLPVAILEKKFLINGEKIPFLPAAANATSKNCSKASFRQFVMALFKQGFYKNYLNQVLTPEYIANYLSVITTYLQPNHVTMPAICVLDEKVIATLVDDFNAEYWSEIRRVPHSGEKKQIENYNYKCLQRLSELFINPAELKRCSSRKVSFGDLVSRRENLRKIFNHLYSPKKEGEPIRSVFDDPTEPHKLIEEMVSLKSYLSFKKQGEQARLGEKALKILQQSLELSDIIAKLDELNEENLEKLRIITVSILNILYMSSASGRFIGTNYLDESYPALEKQWDFKQTTPETYSAPSKAAASGLPKLSPVPIDIQILNAEPFFIVKHHLELTSATKDCSISYEWCLWQIPDVKNEYKGFCWDGKLVFGQVKAKENAYIEWLVNNLLTNSKLNIEYEEHAVKS